MQVHTIERLATVKRRQNNRKACFQLRDLTSFRADRLMEYVISQEEGENSEKKYDTRFITVLSFIYY